MLSVFIWDVFDFGLSILTDQLQGLIFECIRNSTCKESCYTAIAVSNRIEDKLQMYS